MCRFVSQRTSVHVYTCYSDHDKETDRERERKREREGGREGERESPRAHERERERERESERASEIEERGVAGSDPSTRGRSPVVLEVLFCSRAISTRGIQSEIVLGYLYYLGFCTVRSGVIHL